jgi:hypothetical protein
VVKGIPEMTVGNKFTCLFLSLAFQVISLYAGLAPNLHYTLYREQLQNTGFAQLSDIFLLIDEWDGYSIDGYTWNGSVNSLETFQQQNWIILVNDQKIDLKLFESTNINLLPFTPDHIDSVEVYIYPQLEEDVFSDQGLLHFHIRDFPKGLTVQGQFTLGNRTGDPGPYRYTEYRSNNIDRVAADDSYWISYKNTAGFLGVGYISRVYYPTDPFIYDRNKQIYPYGNPVIFSESISLRAGLSNIMSQPQIELSHSSIKDFYFFKPFGREIPAINDLTFIGIKGHIHVKKEYYLGYKFRYTANVLKKRQNLFHLNFDWKEEQYEGIIQADIQKAGYSLQFGVGINHLSIMSGYHLSQNFINNGTLYGSFQFNGISHNTQKIDTRVTMNRNNAAVNTSAVNQWNINNKQVLTGIFSFTQTLPISENTLWYWSERGYDFASNFGDKYQVQGELGPTKKITIDLNWQRNENTTLVVESGMSYRAFLKKTWEDQKFLYDPETGLNAGSIIVKSGESGNAARAFFKLTYNHLPLFNHHLFYRYVTVLGGTKLFRDLWCSVPVHSLLYRLTYKPVENFSIWAMFKYISSTFWSDFSGIDEHSTGKYSAAIPDVYLIDLAVNKWLWKRRIKLKLIFRNLLNQKNISYPIGASLDLRFYAQAEIYLNFY